MAESEASSVTTNRVEIHIDLHSEDGDIYILSTAELPVSCEERRIRILCLSIPRTVVTRRLTSSDTHERWATLRHRKARYARLPCVRVLSHAFLGSRSGGRHDQSVRRHRGGRALRRISHGDAARPQGVQGSRC